MTRHVILLLDIDGTLIDLDSSTSKDNIYWNGIRPETWKIYLNILKENAKAIGIEIYYGIATFRTSPGDDVSDAVIKELKDILHPKLIFFTNQKTKTTHALQPAISVINEERKADVKKSDTMILDDTGDVIYEADKEGYKGISANFIGQSPTEQQETLVKIFKPIYESFGLLKAMPTIEPLSEPEKARIKIEKSSKPSATHYAAQLHDWMRKPSTRIPSPEELKAEGFTSLDVDDDIEPEAQKPTAF